MGISDLCLSCWGDGGLREGGGVSGDGVIGGVCLLLLLLGILNEEGSSSFWGCGGCEM